MENEIGSLDPVRGHGPGPDGSHFELAGDEEICSGGAFCQLLRQRLVRRGHQLQMVGVSCQDSPGHGRHLGAGKFCGGAGASHVLGALHASEAKGAASLGFNLDRSPHRSGVTAGEAHRGNQVS